MAKSYVQEGCVWDWINGTGAAVNSGDVVVIGITQLAIALTYIAIGDVGAAQVEGVFQLTKDSGVSGKGIQQGAKVWWDASAKKIVNAPALNTYFAGYAFRAASTTDTTVDVSLEEFCNEGARLLTLAATGNQALGIGDFVGGNLTLLVPNTAALTVSLPSVATIPFGARLTVRKTTADALAVTLDPSGTEQINGGATFASIDANNDYAVFANNGTAWVLIDSAIA